ncbi:MAG TPA: LysR substrate-binding domain-containing protein [Steroidobacteraceae bacterium]|nr:LysR substrate-binding domain-containing protein [Steroidobacteraceae bacterium]
MPARRFPSLLALRAFEAAARRLSFTEAARELHVSQAAISRHVRGLEKDVGRELFRRLHRAVELTSSGKGLAAELSASFQRIQRAVEAARGTATRRLRVSVEPAFGAQWLVARLERFSSAHPEIELELETSTELRTLGRETDVAIRYVEAGGRPPRGKYRRLFSMDGVPVIAASRRRPANWVEDTAVLGHRLLHDDNGRAWRSWFEAAGLDGFDQAKHLYFTDYALTIAAAVRGQGVALGSAAFIESELETGRLVQLGHTRVPFGEYLLLESTERATAPLRAAFVSWLDSEIKAPPAPARKLTNGPARSSRK